MSRRKNSKAILNISPSDKTCRPLLELVPEFLDERGEILAEKSCELEEKYVHEVYEKMAEHFSHTRGNAWPKVKEFLSSLGPGSLLLDVGCGNGRFLDCLGEKSKAMFVGTDRCKSLLESAKTRNGLLELLIDDCTNLNLRSNIFDGIVCIAVLHHLSTPERRSRAVSELIRCLRRNGTLLIYVWAFEQKKGTIGARDFSSKDAMVPWHFQKKYLKQQEEDNPEDIKDEADTQKTSRSETNDPKNKEEKKSAGREVVMVSPDKYLIALQRYYHLFEEKEVIEMCETGIKMYQERVNNGDCGCEERGFKVSITETYFDCNNWAVKITKV